MSTAIAFIVLASISVAADRTTITFDYAWRHNMSFTTYKPPNTPPNVSGAPERLPAFDDATWELVDVPHDMLIGGNYRSFIIIIILSFS